jgi:hypothetical protein
MDTSKISFDNPILYYKLDPGEMGIATPSTAMLSVARVAGHETGNAARMRAEAIANGGYVIYSAITLDMRKRGAFLAAVAGKTTVEVYYPHGKSKVDNEDGKKVKGEESLSPIQNVEMKLKNALSALRNILKSTVDSSERKRIKEKIAEIQNALNMLKMGNIPVQNIESLVSVYA